jgi:protein-disulfide isomerase
VLGQLLAEFPGKLRVVYKDFPLPSHDRARPAAEAARCAAIMGRFWQYHDALYEAQPAFSPEALLGYGVKVGLDRDAFRACVDGQRGRDAVERDVAEGRAFGVTSTPTFFVNGRRFVGLHAIDTFREAIKDALAETAGK